jgi:uncharacterized protein Veg
MSQLIFSIRNKSGESVSIDAENSRRRSSEKARREGLTANSLLFVFRTRRSAENSDLSIKWIKLIRLLT